ncbi:MAG TPA: GNAT family N-acetyltransferase [Bacillota bacterium]|nr:GNAT family N-acetyltransferase [Bacillota bacterium]
MVIYTESVKSPRDIMSLYEALDWAQYLGVSAEQLDAAMQNSWSVLYAYAGNTLVGTARIISDGVINAYLCGVGVHPGHRGQGIGRELVRQLAQQCASSGLHMQFMCQDELVPMYEKMGFRVFARGMRAERTVAM